MCCWFLCFVRCLWFVVRWLSLFGLGLSSLFEFARVCCVFIVVCFLVLVFLLFVAGCVLSFVVFLLVVCLCFVILRVLLVVACVIDVCCLSLVVRMCGLLFVVLCDVFHCCL